MLEVFDEPQILPGLEEDQVRRGRARIRQRPLVDAHVPQETKGVPVAGLGADRYLVLDRFLGFENRHHRKGPAAA